MMNTARKGSASKENNTYVANCDYSGQYTDVLSFQKGDKFLVIDSNSHRDWWWVQSLQSNQEGYVEPRYLVPEENTPISKAPSTEKGRPDPPPIPPKTIGLPPVKKNVYEKPLPSTPEPRSGQHDGFGGATYDDAIGESIKPQLSTVRISRNGRDSSFSKGWFFGKFSTLECERLLNGQKFKDGTFMVRESMRVPGTYRLSMLYDNTVHHYCIEKHQLSGYFYRDIGVLFRNLDRLVQYYKVAQDDLCCKLSDACLKPKNDTWQIKRETIKLGNGLGSGNFGTVFKGTWDGSQEVAVKMIKKGDVKSKTDFLKEAEMMKDLRHPNIVSLYGVVYDDPVWIVTEYLCNGDLKNYLKGMGSHCRMGDLIDISFQITTGMVYMEKMKYIHRDLRAANVLVGDGLFCKVADFGMARVLDESIYKSTTKKFPTKWTAPEALAYRKFTAKSDVWSFGVLLYEIFTKGGDPYPDMPASVVLPQIERGYRMSKPPSCPEGIYEIMCQCWKKEPEQRLTFQDLQHRLEVYDTYAEDEYTS